MEPYLPITNINDFIFCPRSLYFGNIFRQSESSDCFHGKSQVRGLAAHETIDTGHYSSRKTILTGITVYCEKYKLLGKIDTFDVNSGILTERKYSVTKIYDGFRYQLYAQVFALEEMGYRVSKLKIHALQDNKNYEIPLPSQEEIKAFETLLAQMRAYQIDTPLNINPQKCRHCIYNPLCDLYEFNGDNPNDDLS